MTDRPEMTDWPLILAEHGPAVWRTVYRLLGHHADAQDCYQETFLAAWRFAEGQSGERQSVVDWAPFLVSLSTRRAMDRLRQRYRERARVVAINGAPEPGSEAESPLAHASAEELMDRTRLGMAGLPDKQAEVFWLSCVEGLSHQQISGQTGIPAGEVRVLLHRARTKLRQFLDPTATAKGERHA
jgi:RNA polymerase sigma-70 factor, ECF subfamily